MPEASSREDCLTWVTDELGHAGVIRVDTAVYSSIALFKTAYWYTNRCYLYLSRGSRPETIEVEVRPKSAITRTELETLCREFCNSLIDHQVRQAVIAETGAIREALVRKAFFEGKKHLGLATICSDESAIPSNAQSHIDDPKRIGKITGT